MADKLNELYEAWKKTIKGSRTEFQAFQGGVTAGAVSMRTRAMAVANLSNEAKNAIGALPDIPAK